MKFSTIFFLFLLQPRFGTSFEKEKRKERSSRFPELKKVTFKKRHETSDWKIAVGENAFRTKFSAPSHRPKNYARP
jgi:hypothetical protein